MSNLKLRNNGLTLLGLFSFYFLAWGIANWPGLHQPWWYLDDFYLMKHPADSILSGLTNGRPLEGVWFLTFYLDSSIQAAIQNIFLRFVQGGFHCLAASLGAYFVWKDTQHPSAFFGFLPFALWPFNAEAVMWRSAGGYPIAALLSILAVALVKQQGRYQPVYRLLGAVIFGMAVLFQQVAALAGPVLWLLVVCLRWVQDRPPLGFLGTKEIIYLLAGGISGGLVSIAILSRYDWDMRLAFATNLWDRLSYITNLNVQFFTLQHFYPFWLAFAHVTFLAIAFFLLLATLLKRDRTFSALVSFGFVCLVTFVFPFAPLLVVGESWPSLRVMYLAPLIVSIAWLMIIQLRIGILFRFMVAGLFCFVLLGYVQIAWKNAGEYPLLFEADLQTLQALTETANRQKATEIFVAASPDFPVTQWNPHNIKYMHGDSKLSAFLVDFSADPFIRLFSSLQPTHDADVQAVCVDCCSTAPYDRNSKIDIVESGSILCVCP